MDSDERPTKLRKLDHDSNKILDVDEAPTTQNVSSNPPPVANPPSTITANDPSTPSDIATLESLRPNLKDPTLRALAVSNPGLSKNQLKKLRRQQEWDAAAPTRRLKRKVEIARRKETKRTQRAALLASGIDPMSLHKGSHRPRAVQLPVTIVVDCSFDNLMSDGERTSLGAQVTRAYSDNKHARWRAHLVVSSWGGRLRERFEGVLRGHYRGWRGVRFEEEGFGMVVERARGWMGEGDEGGRLAGPFEREEEVKPGLQEQGEVVYLSSESPDTLTELKPYSTYIIGGLVDKNREKGICYKRAKEAGIKTARLPIGDYLQMASRKVLATNHVVEIMLKWLEYEDWGKAFLEVIPKRKGGQLKDEGKNGGGEQADSGSEIEADDVENGARAANGSALNSTT
ncbi:guanine-1-methyltransferase-domain-containing protein [Elsinoe ampelina]|uniref:tRNA (guanine(9)-N1)-methyltransferase n=1 Tax=Elsinoe ampelina TaxID=302913 RepID=A0A6A6G0Y7_9PEZI|nr:guanine-1-methyltransferase-domain-containing protein [Elsinoe ampelina]